MMFMTGNDVTIYALLPIKIAPLRNVLHETARNAKFICIKLIPIHGDDIAATGFRPLRVRRLLVAHSLVLLAFQSGPEPMMKEDS